MCNSCLEFVLLVESQRIIITIRIGLSGVTRPKILGGIKLPILLPESSILNIFGGGLYDFGEGYAPKVPLVALMLVLLNILIRDDNLKRIPMPSYRS